MQINLLLSFTTSKSGMEGNSHIALALQEYKTIFMILISSYSSRLEVFPIKPDIDDGLGNPEWRLTLCLLFSWILVFLSLVKGVKSSGKVGE
jgi:hypothetical protein